MSLTIPQLLIRLTLLPMVLAAVIGVLRWRVLPPNLRALVLLMGFVLPLNVLGMALMMQHRNNLFLMPLYAAGEFALMALVYYRTLRAGRLRRALPWLAGGFALYVLIDSLDVAALRSFRPGQQLVQGLLTLLVTGGYFRQLLNELPAGRLRREPMFWVSCGLFIYQAGYLQIALFSNYLLRYSKELNMYVWAGHSVLFIFHYLCYSLALALRPQPERRPAAAVPA
ncbi:hypothetical protein EJV47_20695 [Hymenobacter gummosus]|uniref:Lysoplasmalogenase n=1 Tax=Hymenobacter gummosus TaxID=1776032 RepID=A0A431TY94_9BACT|nr:hypothetical protein [Hymenobacter gummosus]RTQ46795.1 hypothetical protein EJV47_20695 [Hymenobacter gummosus]